MNENWWFENTKKYQKTKGNILLEFPVKFGPERITECGDIAKSVKNIQYAFFYNNKNALRIEYNASL